MDQPGLLEQNIFITCMRGDHESRSLYTLKQEKRNHLNYLLQMRRLDRARHSRDLIGNEVWKRKSDDVVVSQWWRLMKFEIKAAFGACRSVWVCGANIVTTKNKWVKTNRKWVFLCGRAQLSNPQAIFLVLSGLQSKIKKIFFNFYFQLKITQNWAFLCQRATIL